MHYHEYPPAPRVAALVHCVWTLEGHAAELGAAVQPIVPDGRPELILHFGDAFERLHSNGRVEQQPAVIFAGQLTSELVLRPTGRIAVLGVRLHPHGAAALLRQPQDELAGRTIGVEDVSRALSRSLADTQDATTTLEQAVWLVQERLACLADPSRVDARVAAAVAAIQRRHGCISIDRVALDAGMTRRHLERRFKEAVGMSPKRLARIARLQRALRVLERAELPQRGAYTAAACGYADQAHFIRECRELCGRPPGAHLLHRATLTGFFLD